MSVRLVVRPTVVVLVVVLIVAVVIATTDRGSRGERLNARLRHTMRVAPHSIKVDVPLSLITQPSGFWIWAVYTMSDDSKMDLIKELITRILCAQSVRCSSRYGL